MPKTPRATAETARATEEGKRVIAETSRSTEEGKRVKAEELRTTETAQSLLDVNEATGKALGAATLANEQATHARLAAEKGEILNANQAQIQLNADGVLTWWVFDLEQNQYINTTLPARGPKGKGPLVLPNGNYGNWDDTVGDYVDSGVQALATLDSIPVNFVPTEERETLNTGDTIPILFGKLKKWLSDLGLLAWKNTVDYNSDIENLPEIPEEQIPADWQQEDSAQRDYIKNKPFIPAKVSDIENDIDLQSGSQVHNFVRVHNTSDVAHEDIRVKLSEVEAIAKGRSRAEPFDTLEELNEWLTHPENTAKLKIGDNLYIRELGVPDFWWDGAKIQPLEVEKVDLSIFYSKEQSNLRFSLKPIQKTVILLPDNWIKDENFWTLRIGDVDVTDGCFIEAWPIDKESKEVASSIDIYENINISDGTFILNAEQRPSKPIHITYTIIR